MRRLGDTHTSTYITCINDGVGTATVLRKVMGAYKVRAARTGNSLQITLAMETTPKHHLDMRMRPREPGREFWIALGDTSDDEHAKKEKKEKVPYKSHEQDLLVVDIPRGGPLEAWNKANPDMTVRAGDRIVSINFEQDKRRMA